MGLVKLGVPLSWDESKPYLKYVREHGITQFLNTYSLLVDIKKDELKWGEEVEVGIFQLTDLDSEHFDGVNPRHLSDSESQKAEKESKTIDKSEKKVFLSCRSKELIEFLANKENDYKAHLDRMIIDIISQKNTKKD